jgi:hypothetical protein
LLFSSFPLSHSPTPPSPIVALHAPRRNFHWSRRSCLL